MVAVLSELRVNTTAGAGVGGGGARAEAPMAKTTQATSSDAKRDMARERMRSIDEMTSENETRCTLRR